MVSGGQERGGGRRTAMLLLALLVVLEAARIVLVHGEGDAADVCLGVFVVGIVEQPRLLGRLRGRCMAVPAALAAVGMRRLPCACHVGERTFLATKTKFRAEGASGP